MAGKDALDMSRSMCSTAADPWDFAEGHTGSSGGTSGYSSPASPCRSTVRDKIHTFSEALVMTRSEVQHLRTAISALESKFLNSTDWVSYHKDLANASEEIKEWRDKVEDDRQQFIFRIKKELKEEILSCPLDEERMQKAMWPDMETLRVAMRRMEEKCEDVAQKLGAHSEDQVNWIHSISKIMDSDREQRESTARRYDMKLHALENELKSIDFKLPGGEHLPGGLAAQCDEVGAYMRSMHQESYEFRSSLETQVSSLSASLKQMETVAVESQLRLEAVAAESQLQVGKQVESARFSDTMHSDLQEIRSILEKSMAQESQRDAQLQHVCVTLEKLQASKPTAMVDEREASCDDISARLERISSMLKSSPSATQLPASSDGGFIPHERSPSVRKSPPSPNPILCRSPRGSKVSISKPVSRTASPSTGLQIKPSKVLVSRPPPSVSASQIPARTSIPCSPQSLSRSTSMCKALLSTPATPPSANRR